MNTWQNIFLVGYGFVSFFVFSKGFYESIKKKSAFKETPPLWWMGIFVWGDAIIFGPFWFSSAVISYFLRDWLLFLLIFSVFWVVRSIGETVYWLNQQFSSVNNNPPEKMRGYRFVRNNSIWFLYQIFWQCVTVISLLTTVYLAALWLKVLG